MPPQLAIFYLFLVLAAIVFTVFVAVALSSRSPREVPQLAIQRTRLGFLILLCLVLLPALGFTLVKLPYEMWAGDVPDRLIFVAGKQFAFAVSESPVLTDQEWQAKTMAAPVEVPAGSLLEMRVTSFDVNHSAALYDPDGVLIAQVQAMPGYVNRLRVRLDRPGRYNLLCLELCGNSHSRMRGVLQVRGGA
jgi:cytochrome c oxidase subunit II